MKKNHVLLSIGLIIALGILASYQGVPGKPTSPAQEKLKTRQQVAERVEVISAQTVDHTWEGKVEPHYQTNGFIITADFLYWKADEDGLEYNMKIKTDPTVSGGALGPNAPPLTIDRQNLDFKWNPGFRVGVGGQLGNLDHWDVYSNYTYLYTKADNSQGATSSTLESPTWDALFLGLSAIHAKANWTLHYNTLDIELGKDYFVGTHLTLRPFLGLRGALILQNCHARYQQNPEAPLPVAKFDAKCNFGGGGIRAGADMLWHFQRHWGLYGEISGALLYGRFHVKQVSLGDQIVGETPHIFPEMTVRENLWRTRATVQAALGFEWETLFNRDRSRIALSLGYEFNLWFQQNQFMRQDTVITGEGIPIFFPLPSNGDLGLQGGVFKATFDF